MQITVRACCHAQANSHWGESRSCQLLAVTHDKQSHAKPHEKARINNGGVMPTALLPRNRCTSAMLNGEAYKNLRVLFDKPRTKNNAFTTL